VKLMEMPRDGVSSTSAPSDGPGGDVVGDLAQKVWEPWPSFPPLSRGEAVPGWAGPGWRSQTLPWWRVITLRSATHTAPRPTRSHSLTHWWELLCPKSCHRGCNLSS